jgi:site-specific DNA recombinase
MEVKKKSKSKKLFRGGRSDIQIFTSECNEEKQKSGSSRCKPVPAASSRFGNKEQRVAIYARVSTTGQEKEDTIESQLIQLKEYVASLGIVLDEDAIYEDNGFSGANMSRPGLEMLRDKIAEGYYDVVFVLDPDRLARKFILQMILLDEFKSNDCQLQFITRPIGESPEEQLLLQVQGVISEYERAKIQERTRRGKLHRMKQGEIVTGRRVFGYHYIPKRHDVPARYEINDTEAGFVKDIFNWYISENISLREICRRLTDLGVETVKNGRWRVGTLHGIFKNSIYTGTGYANKQDCSDNVASSIFNTGKIIKKRRIRSRDEWLTFGAPCIIDEETFELAQNKLHLNSKRSSRNTKGKYLLRSLLVCGKCQQKMRIDTQSQKYICFFTRPATVKESDHGCLCSNKTKMLITDLDDIVWKELKAILSKPSRLKKYYNTMQGEVIPKVSGANRNILSERCTATEQRIKRINNLFIRGVISEDEHKKQYNDWKGKLNTMQGQLEKLDKQYLSREQISNMLESVKKFVEIIKQELNDSSFETKRKIVELMVKQVIIDEKNVTIEYYIPIKKYNLCMLGEHRTSNIE